LLKVERIVYLLCPRLTAKATRAPWFRNRRPFN